MVRCMNGQVAEHEFDHCKKKKKKKTLVSKAAGKWDLGEQTYARAQLGVEARPPSRRERPKLVPNGLILPPTLDDNQPHRRPTAPATPPGVSPSHSQHAKSSRAQTRATVIRFLVGIEMID